MIAIDTNILIDLLVSSTPRHVETTDNLSHPPEDLCTTPTNIGECLRLITHPKVFPKPLSLGQAVSALGKMLDYYGIRILEEPTDWWQSLSEIEKENPGIRGNEVFDARIALCLRAHNVKKISTRDADFKKYSFLKIVGWTKK